MRVADIQRLYDYSSWANARLLAVVSQLRPEEFTRPIAGSYRSIRNTLVHILSAEWGWLERCGGPPRGDRLRPEDFSSAASLSEIWRRVEKDMRELLAGLTGADLERTVEFTIAGGQPQSLPLADLLLHAVVHAVHHRGQVALLLRELGVTPGNFDLLIYAIESPSLRLVGAGTRRGK